MNRSVILSLAVVAISVFSCKDKEESNIWDGPTVTFDVSFEDDWTLTANQDRISTKVTFTRQNRGPIYNYQWFQETFQQDAVYDDLGYDFWGADNWDYTGSLDFTPAGGTQGVRWAILDNTGGTNWPANFDMFGQLGNPEHFYSLHNIASMLTELENGVEIASIPNDYSVEVAGGAIRTGTDMTLLVGKKLALWLVEENKYLTFEFTSWGSGGSGSQQPITAWKRSTKK